MIEIAAQALILVAFGAHVSVPWRLGGEKASSSGARRAWSLGALPLLLAASILGLYLIHSRPDAALGAGWGSSSFAGAVVTAVAFLVTALAGADLLVALAGEKLEAPGWRLSALFALLPLAAVSTGAELFRLGAGPASDVAPFVLAVVCRTLLALAAGELAAPGELRLALPAGLLFALYLPVLPSAVRGALLAGGDLLTLGAACLLLVACRWLPAALRRPALGAGVMLAAIFLSRAASVSGSLVPRPGPLPGLPAF